MQLVLRENNPFDFKFTNQAFIFLIFFFFWRSLSKPLWRMGFLKYFCYYYNNMLCYVTIIIISNNIIYITITITYIIIIIIITIIITIIIIIIDIVINLLYFIPMFSLYS